MNCVRARRIGMNRPLFLATMLAILRQIASCNVDKREMILHATQVSRAVQLTTKNCLPMVQAVRPLPSSDLTTRFLRSLCEISVQCVEELKTYDKKVIIPCAQPRLWERWGDLEQYNLTMKKYIEKIVLCGMDTVPDMKIAWIGLHTAFKLLG
ncbi:uncharacterized protein LOC142803523 isoform X1 [Rhipicephalus microplus]|uniref:uncharacterized protein LOC142803523 isoform X1 n=1 Tax=Rhipicephalus microplus TaxID=6941 RepID=UPI003F6C735A